MLAEKEEKLEEATKAIGMALKNSSPEEKEFLANLRKEIDSAAEAAEPGQNFDKRLEFCYGIIFAGDKIQNQMLIKAARHYIDIYEGN